MNADKYFSLENLYCNSGEIVGTSVVKVYVVDTRFAYDVGKFETAIWRDEGPVIIVDYYDDKILAANGHQYYKNLMESEPNQIWSPQTQQVERF